MSKKDPKLIVLQFNECINNRDIKALANLMSDEYVFIGNNDKINNEGKESMIKGWNDFFNQHPDYLNHFSIVESRNNLVLVIGYSTCSFKPLDGPALWTAKIENDLVAEWRIYLDTTKNRKKLNLKT